MDRWLKNNLVVKILAILLALMLWMVVNQERIFEKRQTIDIPENISREINRVPVNGHLDSDNFVIVQMQQNIDVVLRGKRETLAGITPTSYEVYVDLAGYGEGVHKVPVKTKGFPTGVEIELRPAVIDVTLEAKQVREMPVTYEIVGMPKEGYTVGTPTVIPTAVTVKAAGSQVKQAAVAKVFINIDGATEMIKRSLKLRVLDTNGNDILAEVEPATIEISVPIIPPSVTVPLQVQLAGEPPAGYAVAKVETNVNEVTIFGPKETIAGINSYPLSGIDVSEMRSTQTLTLKLPVEAITKSGKVDLVPDEVAVTITIVPSEVLTLADQSIQVKGLAADDLVTFVTPVNGKFDVMLEGAHEFLQGITAANVRAAIDVSGLTHGEHDVPIEWIFPSYTKLTNDNPRTAKIIIKDKADEASTTPDDPSDSEPGEDPDASNGN